MVPKLITRVPGPKSRKLAKKLARYESRNVTFLGPPGPIFWEKAEGSNVWDVDGNRYLDLTSAFGVASLGHTHRLIRNAIERQARDLLHGMGDVHPSGKKVELLRELAAVTFGRWTGGRLQAQSVLGNSGFEAIEIAMKTALLKTGRNRIVAFRGAYHGVGFGALQATWREEFRKPFSAQLRELTAFLPYPRRAGEVASLEKSLRRLLRTGKVGAVLVEPVQGRGGIVIPPTSFLPMLRKCCNDTRTLLIADEVFTGFWRTGKMFAVEHTGVVPDLICLGKALTGSLPLSACVGKRSVMQAWPKSRGEAIHTTTFLGNPLACAAALASIEAWKSGLWESRIALSHGHLMGRLRDNLEPDPAVHAVRGIGLMAGVELAPGTAGRVAQCMLRRGVLVLPEGPREEVLSLTPPLLMSLSEIDFAVRQLKLSLGR